MESDSNELNWDASSAGSGGEFMFPNEIDDGTNNQQTWSLASPRPVGGRLCHSESWVDTEVGQCMSIGLSSRGFSLFQAISDQLDRAICPLQLRRLAVEFMEEHVMEFQALLIRLGLELIEGEELLVHGADVANLPRMVLDLLKLPGTRAGEECIIALSRRLNREIRVYQEHGRSVRFCPSVMSSDLPVLRIIYRYDQRDMRYRTHYESVQEWRLHPTSLPTANTDTSSGNHELPANKPHSKSVSVQADIKVPRSSSPKISKKSSQKRKLSASETSKHLLMRGDKTYGEYGPEELSDEEYLPVNASRITARWQKCFSCEVRIGRYMILGCGAFPLCGTCIRTWFVVMKNKNCPHCGVPILGWAKTFNQN